MTITLDMLPYNSLLYLVSLFTKGERMKTRGVYTVFFDDGVDFRKRMKSLVIKVSNEKGETVTQADVLRMAIEEFEARFKS